METQSSGRLHFSPLSSSREFTRRYNITWRAPWPKREKTQLVKWWLWRPLVLPLLEPNQLVQLVNYSVRHQVY